MAPRIYRKLPGSGRSSSAVLSARHRLWLGPDHVLAVCNQGYSEEYKRFQFKDIQAISLRKTAAGWITNVLLACAAGFFAGLAFYTWARGWDEVGVWILGGVGGAFGLGLLTNTLLGPTCVCTLRTAVQTERLYSLPRFRTAQRAIRRIREAVEAVQGALPAELIDAEVAAAAAAGTVTAVPLAATTATRRGLKPYRSRAHAVLFSILLVDVVHSAFQFFWQSVVMYILSMLILLGLLASMVVALIRQSDTDLDPGVKRWTWATMGYVMAAYVLNTVVLYIFMGLSGPGMGDSSGMWGVMEAIWKTSPFDSIPILIMLLFSILGSGVFGALGWARLAAFRRRRRDSPPPAGTPPLPPV